MRLFASLSPYICGLNTQTMGLLKLLQYIIFICFLLFYCIMIHQIAGLTLLYLLTVLADAIVLDLCSAPDMHTR